MRENIFIVMAALTNVGTNQGHICVDIYLLFSLFIDIFIVHTVRTIFQGIH